MIRLTLIHWHDKSKGALLLNPRYIVAVSRHVRDGDQFTQVNVEGYSYTVAETVDEVANIILAAEVK